MIHELPELHKNIQIPTYVSSWAENRARDLYDSLSEKIKEQRLDDATDSKRILKKNLKLLDAIEDFFLQAYRVLAEKLYLTARNEVYINSKNRKYAGDKMRRKVVYDLSDDGKYPNFNSPRMTEKISEEKIQNRFEFLVDLLVKRGIGFIERFNAATFIDAIIQDLQQEDSVILRQLSQKNLKSGKFVEPDKIFSKLLRQHRFLIKLDSNLTEEEAFRLPPVFVKNEDGSDKEYILRQRNEKIRKKPKSEFVFKVRKLDEPNDLELTTYLQNFCIGEDDMEYKKSLLDGSMLFFSVESELSEPTTLGEAVNDVELEHRKYIVRQGEDDDINWSGYLVDAIEQRGVALQDFKIRRNPKNALTINLRVSSNKTVLFDQAKFSYNKTFDQLVDLRFVTLFFDKILPDICSTLQKQGYKIKGFGEDFSCIVPDDGVYVVGNGPTKIWDVKENDILIADPNKEYHVPKNISKEKLVSLCQKGIRLNITNIADNQELLRSIRTATGQLICNAEVVDLPNLESAERIFFHNSKIVRLPKLRTLTGKINVDTFNSATHLYLDSLKRIEGSLHLKNLQSGNFNSLEEIEGGLGLPALALDQVWSFPKLKKVKRIGTEYDSPYGGRYSCPVLEEVEYMQIEADGSYYPRLRKVINLQVIDCSVDLPSLEQVSDSIMVKYYGSKRMNEVYLNFPNLVKTYSLQIFSGEFQKVKLDITRLETWNLDAPKSRIPKNTIVIHAFKKAFQSFSAGEYGLKRDEHPEENIYSSRGQYAVMNPGKFWSDTGLTD